MGLYNGGVWDHPSSGENQEKVRTNQPQLTLAQDCDRKREFRVPRFVADNQAVFQAPYDERGRDANDG